MSAQASDKRTDGGQRRAPAASAAVASAAPPLATKVIYVLGAGRSGSTILGVALGNCDGVFFAGELNKWLHGGGEPTLEDPERVAFWSGVRRRVEGAEELFGYQVACLERPSLLFKRRSWRARRRLRAAYRRVAQQLYEAIAQASGSQVIVDTSHYSLRALELQALPGIELYLVYLVRDPQGVVRSFARKDVVERSFGMLATNAYLWLTHAFALLAFLKHPRARRLLVRHEEFRAEPQRVLRAILDMVGSHAELPQLSALQVGVPLHGNRLARHSTVSVESDPPAPARGSLATTLLQLPWTVVFALLRPRLRSRRSLSARERA